MNPPKPQALKVLQGTDRADRAQIVEDPDVFAPYDAMPETPDWLPNEWAAKEFVDLGTLMIRARKLHAGNIGLLEMTAAWRGRMIQGIRAGNTPKSAEIAQYRGCLQQLGLTQQPGDGAGPTKNRFSKFAKT